MRKSIAFFDFDGTLTRRDTLADFLIYSFSIRELILKFFVLMPTIFKYLLGYLDNGKAKQLVYRQFFSGMSERDLKEKGKKYSSDKLIRLFRPLGLEKINWHLKQGHLVVVVSASSEYWIKPWANQIGVTCITTKLEVNQGIITGKFHGLNCFGNEKVRRICDHFHLPEYEKIYAYGDSRGDLEMLEIAHFSFYKPFRAN